MQEVRVLAKPRRTRHRPRPGPTAGPKASPALARWSSVRSLDATGNRGSGHCLSIVNEAAEDDADGGPAGSLDKAAPLDAGGPGRSDSESQPGSDEDAVEVSRDAGGGLELAAELSPTRAHAALSHRASAADAAGVDGEPHRSRPTI